MRVSITVLLKSVRNVLIGVGVLTGCLIIPTLGLAEEAGANVLFILDVSGSMWGRLDTVEKIVIAKERLSELVNELPDNVNIGLMVYGHRSKGDCNDIELLTPVGTGNRERILAQMQTIIPKGKTPITQSIALAAQQLETLEDETSIVLVSDGEETCASDPCAYTKTQKEELAAKGIEFTMHVVGFDVNTAQRTQLECIANAGGGRYFSAQNAMQLKEAFTEVKKEVVKKVSTGNQYALQFDGVDDYVNVRLDKSLINHANLTLEAWVNVSYQQLRKKYTIISNLGVWQASGGYQMKLQTPAPSPIWAYFRDDGHAGREISSSTQLIVNQWYHTASTWEYNGDSTMVKVYVNGILEGSQTFTGKINYDALHKFLTIGTNIDGVGGSSRPIAREFMGKIDEVRVWNVTRSQAEIQATMNSQLNGNEPGLMAYWKFNEGSGTLAADSSSNSNTGTLVNGPIWTTDTPF